jgi:hypothetical protein
MSIKEYPRNIHTAAKDNTQQQTAQQRRMQEKCIIQYFKIILIRI